MGMQQVSRTCLFYTGTIYHYTIRGVIWCTAPTRTAVAAFNLFSILRISLSIYSGVREVFVIPRQIWWVGKIRSSALSCQIPMMLYQKSANSCICWCSLSATAMTCPFIGHCLHTWTTRFMLLHNLTSQEHKNLPDWCFGLNWIRCG